MMTEYHERRHSRWGGRAVKGGIALLCAFVLAIGLAAPVFASPGVGSGADQVDEDGLDLNRYSKWSRPLLDVVVALDPGHNGGNAENRQAIAQRVSDGRGEATACDTVGTRTHSGYAEHELTFDVAEVLSERLEYLGATVLFTRTDDTGVGPCVDLRGRFAEDNDVDLMLSLHASGGRTTVFNDGERAGPGFYVTVSDPALSASQADPSRELAEAVVTGLLEGGLPANQDVEEAIAGRDDLASLNFARRPAVRVNLGQMRDRTEAEFMESEEGRAAYAEALAQGVVLWHRDDAR